MTDFPILRDLGLILVAAAAMSLLARLVRVPPILAYIVAGLLLGPATHLLAPTESLELFSGLGVALLLFLVGLELSLERIRDVARTAVVVGVSQIVLTVAFGYLLAFLFGFRGLAGVLLALALTFSSTVVVVKLLERRGDVHALYGRISVGILLVQDVAVAVALTLLAGIEAGGAVDIGSFGRGVITASGGMLALVALAAVATRWILPRVFDWLSPSAEAVFIWSLSWCFGFILAAQVFGLSVEIGAFVAGVSLAQLSHSDELGPRVHPLVNFFLAVFFVTLGVHMEIGDALARWPLVLALSAFVIIAKPLILMALIPRLGHGQRSSFFAALSLGQLSEFSFILASLAVASGLVGEDFLALIGAVGLITIGVSAVLTQGGDGLYEWFHRRGLLRPFRAHTRAEEPKEVTLSGHVIVVGMNALGRRVVEGLVLRGETVLAVDTDQGKLEGMSSCATLAGNSEYPSVLALAELPKAKLLVSALQIEDSNNLLAYRARRAGIPSSIHAFDPILAPELREYGASHLMVSKHDGIRVLVKALRDEGVID